MMSALDGHCMYQSLLDESILNEGHRDGDSQKKKKAKFLQLEDRMKCCRHMGDCMYSESMDVYSALYWGTLLHGYYVTQG